MTSQPENSVPSWLVNWSGFVKAHEKLIIVAVSAVLLFKTGQGIENIILKHDQLKSQQAAIVVQQDTVTNKQLQDELSQIKNDAVEKTKQLNADITSKIQSLLAQQKKDSQSTPTEIDARWQGLLPLKTGAITPLDSLTTSVTNEAANQTVQALEEIPVLKNQVADLNTEIDSDQKVIISQDGLISGLNKQIVDEKKSHVDDVNTEKQKGKRKFWKGFKIGFIAGAVGLEAIRVWAGHP